MAFYVRVPSDVKIAQASLRSDQMFDKNNDTTKERNNSVSSKSCTAYDYLRCLKK